MSCLITASLLSNAGLGSWICTLIHVFQTQDSYSTKDKIGQRPLARLVWATGKFLRFPTRCVCGRTMVFNLVHTSLCCPNPTNPTPTSHVHNKIYPKHFRMNFEFSQTILAFNLCVFCSKTDNNSYFGDRNRTHNM